MRVTSALFALSMASVLVSALAQPSPDDGRGAAPTAADVIIPDEAVIREMLKTPHTLPESAIRDGLRHCDGNSRQMKVCGAYRWTVQDLRLNRIYAKALAAAREAGTDASLTRAEKAWLSYRDAQCAFEGQAGAGGGTEEGLYVLACKEDLTKQQADRLESARIP